MIVLLALLAAFVIFMTIPGLFFKSEKIQREMIERSKRIDELKAAKNLAEKNGTEEEIEAAQTAYWQEIGKGCFGCVANCLSAIVHLARGLILMASEFALIIAALAMHVGMPIVGYVALASWIICLIYDFVITPKQYAREREEAEALGNVYIVKTNPLRTVVGLIPDAYALYILLVIIGIL